MSNGLHCSRSIVKEWSKQVARLPADDVKHSRSCSILAKKCSWLVRGRVSENEQKCVREYLMKSGFFMASYPESV